MRLALLRVVAPSCALLAVTGPAILAQPSHATPSPGGESARTVGFWVAAAHNALLKTRVGHEHDRDLYVMGIRFAWAAPGPRRIRLAYTIDALPAVVSTDMPEYRPVPCRPSECAGTTFAVYMARHTVFGAGIAPVGLEAHLALTRRLGLVAAASGGLIWFTSPIPDPGERRLNFTGDARGGVEIDLARRIRLAIGYRFNHISNGGAGPINPGMNSHMLEIGFTTNGR
jgi:hypothetical protein